MGGEGDRLHLTGESDPRFWFPSGRWVDIALCRLDAVLATMATASRMAFAGATHEKTVADGSQDVGPCFPVFDVP